jgi:hypothetical protein
MDDFDIGSYDRFIRGISGSTPDFDIKSYGDAIGDITSGGSGRVFDQTSASNLASQMAGLSNTDLSGSDFGSLVNRFTDAGSGVLSSIGEGLASLGGGGAGGESPGFLDKILSAGKEALPDLLKTLLSKGADAASGLLGAGGGLGGLATGALLASLLNKKDAAPQAPSYIGLGAAGPAPAAEAPKFVALPSQAQSYKSMMGMKDGGPVHMQSGDFVFSKKAMDKVGGVKGLAKRGYNAEKIVGPGTGTSDSIPATIDGKEVARVANGEGLIRGGAKQKGLAALHKQMRRA